MKKWDCIDFAGGGFDIFRTVGVITELAYCQSDIFEKVKHVSGVSAGAVLAIIFALSKGDSDVILREFMSFDFESLNLFEFTEEAIHSLVFNSGFNTRERVLPTLIDPVLKRLASSEHITLKDMFELTGIHVCLRSVDLATNKVIHMNHETFPTMPVRQAAWASCALPWIVEPVRELGMHLVDGGLLENVNINCFADNNYTPENPLSIHFNKSWATLMGSSLTQLQKTEHRHEDIFKTHASIAHAVLLAPITKLQSIACAAIPHEHKLVIPVENSSTLLKKNEIATSKLNLIQQGRKVGEEYVIRKFISEFTKMSMALSLLHHARNVKHNTRSNDGDSLL